MNMRNHGVECNIRVKSGDLAAQGKGKMGILPMSEGRFRIDLSLPDAAGVCSPVDLTNIERVELVKTKVGWFDKGEWVKPLIGTVGALGVSPMLIFPLPIWQLFPDILETVFDYLLAYLIVGLPVGAWYASGVYTGTKLKRVARFIVTTQDGRHAVLEGPESVFRFMSGVYAAPNIQLEAVDSEASSAPSSEPVPTPA